LDRIKSKKPVYPDASFFDELANNIVAQNQNIVFKRPIYKRPFVQWIAAAVVIPMILFFVLHKTDSPTQSAFAMLDKVPTETISAYVEAQQFSGTPLEVRSSAINEKNWSINVVNELVSEIPVSEVSSYLEEEYGDWDLEDVE